MPNNLPRTPEQTQNLLNLKAVVEKVKPKDLDMAQWVGNRTKCAGEYYLRKYDDKAWLDWHKHFGITESDLDALFYCTDLKGEEAKKHVLNTINDILNPPETKETPSA